MATTIPVTAGQTDLLGGEAAGPSLEQIECEALAGWMVRNGCKPPTITKTWLDAAKRLRTIDGRSHEQIMACIEWCQRDEFWQANIHSMPKLRMQYDKLRAAAMRDRRPAQVRQQESKKDAQFALREKFRQQRMARGAA